MKMILVVGIVIAVCYFILAFALAEFFSILLFTPPVRFRPTKEQVIANDVKEFASCYVFRCRL